jgi:hypothetical protein
MQELSMKMGKPTAFIPALFPVLLAAQAGTAPKFRDSLYPVLQAARCADCHNDNGVASTTRLRFPPADAPADTVEVFGRSLARLIDAEDISRSLLLLKPTNRTPHAGGERIHIGSHEEHVLQAWVSHLAAVGPAPVNAADHRPRVQRPLLRRLTNAQYDNTVADLLGDRTKPAARFPSEDFIHGFTNQSAGQGLSPLLAEDYSRAAQRLARNALRSGKLEKIISCKPVSPADAGCAAEFIRGFGLRAFRRPLTSEELEVFTRLLTDEAQRAGSFLSGAHLVLESMLQSPAFLYHTGTGSYAVASRLSYFLWDTAPGERLLELARAGALETPQRVETEARRMLSDPRARQAMNQFLAQWLRFDRVRGALRERKLFPEFGPELVDAMLEETTRLFENVVWTDRNFMELFTARYSFINAALAQLYGLPAPEREFSRVDYPPDFKRAGVLGHASFLTLTSKPEETAPTERGLFIRQHFLCQSVPPPPPGVDTSLPALSEEKPMTNRDRLSVHLTNPSCAGCHRLVDPIGFGFEQFDAIGRYREKQAVLVYPAVDKVKQNTRREGVIRELPVDTSASILGVPNSAFSTPAGASHILARQNACQRCVAKQLFRFALGRLETDADQPYIDAAFERFRASGFRFKELILAIVTSEPFLEQAENRT